jgi:signal transduction histidine kinase
MRRRLLAGFVLFAAVVIIALEVPLGLLISAKERTSALNELQGEGQSLAVLVASSLRPGQQPALQAVLNSFARSEGGVVSVIDGGRTVAVAGPGATEELGDSGTQAIVRAAASGTETGEEGSQDPDDDYLYVALPVAKAAGQDVVLLVTSPAGPLHSRVSADLLRLALIGIGMLALAAAAGALLARSMTRRLQEIEVAVAAVGAGDLAARAPTDRGPADFKAFAETVNEMAERLEELVHTQKAFVADASHQLRTPLTALSLRLENLEGSSSPEAEADVRAAMAEADRLSRIVDGLLALARTEGTRPVRVPVDVPAVLDDRLEAWTPLAEERQVHLSRGEAAWRGSNRSPAGLTKIDGPQRALACDGHLEQMLDNLLANALDATPAGGSVSLFSLNGGGDVEVHVVDTGPGMTADERERAFDRFWRPEGAKQEGSGLGLAIVAQLARVSGGVAWLAAGPSGGVDAVVRLDAC